MKKMIVVVVMLTLVFTSSFAFAVDDSTAIMGDALILKPVGAVVTIAGTVLFIVSWPLAAITNSSDHTFDVLVKQPYDYTFNRPLGEIPSAL